MSKLIDSENLFDELTEFVDEETANKIIRYCEDKTPITCKDCKWWDENDRNCNACKHGHISTRWEIIIHRKTKPDFYCADAERKGDFI